MKEFKARFDFLDWVLIHDVYPKSAKRKNDRIETSYF